MKTAINLLFSLNIFIILIKMYLEKNDKLHKKIQLILNDMFLVIACGIIILNHY